MAKNYLIGVGGTGARVIESVVQCCAAGSGPDSLSIFLVDPDDGNGNLSKTKELLTDYQRCRAAIKERSDPDVKLFGTRIETPDPFVWSIFADQNVSLGSYIRYTNVQEHNPELAQLIEVLFTEKELKTQLNEGFRGHPSIGAVVMANAPENVEPWRSFWADVDSNEGENSVRVFLVGSIFGGTGAAGVPTFGAPKMLKQHPRATISDVAPAEPDGTGRRKKARSKIFLGTSLVLPYFTVDLANLPDEQREMFVTAADYPIATKAALQYYDEKYGAGQLAFDQVYLIGDSMPQAVGAFSTGNKQQRNRPHYVELATALAAFDFFEQGPSSETGNDTLPFFVTSRDAAKVVDWRALPVTRNAGQAEVMRREFKRRVAAMTVFAYAFNTLGKSVLARTDHERIDEGWYRRHFRFKPGRAEDVEKDPRKEREAVESLVKFNRGFLLWAAALHDKDDRVQLIDRTKLFSFSPDNVPVDLLDPKLNDAAIGVVLKNESGQAPKFSEFINRLEALDLDRPELTAISRYVSLFYEAALDFVATNWRLPRPAKVTR